MAAVYAEHLHPITELDDENQGALEEAKEAFDKSQNCLERAHRLATWDLINFSQDDQGAEGLRRLMLYIMEKAHNAGFSEGRE